MPKPEKPTLIVLKDKGLIFSNIRQTTNDNGLTTCLDDGERLEGLNEAIQCLVTGSNDTLMQDPISKQ